MFNLECDVNIAFFNLNFDGSQFIKWLITESGLEVRNDSYFTPKGTIKILESERRLYSIEIRGFNGRLITMIDIANFLVGVTLNKACEDWLNDKKVEIESKQFLKEPATPLEKEYAIKDAELTYRLYLEVCDKGVIEGHKSITIAGRTIKHFKEFMGNEYSLKFYDFFYKNADPETIKEIKADFENEIRSGVRGGICEAWHKGVFDNCTHIDACSMYPTQCIKPLIPIGGLLIDKPNSAYTKIVYPSGFYTLKEGKVPNMQWRSKSQCRAYHFISEYEAGEFVSDFYLDGTYPIWLDEYELIKRTYDVYQEDIEKEYYIEMANNSVLANYVKMLYEGKQNNSGSKRLYYKYLLNALYGKFLSRPDGLSIDYVFDGDSWHRIKVNTEKNTYYLPLGSWIAMSGRVSLINAIHSINESDFLYCDTDSIIFKGSKMPKVNIGNYLGDWSIEQEDVKVNVVGAKTYQELTTKGKLITKCGGLPTTEKSKLEWLQLQEGLTVETHKPKRDKDSWAINIEDVTYTINTRANTWLR